MNSSAWFALLLAANVVLFWLPLLPALREWRRRGGEPLHIPADDETGTDFFAERFRQRLMADWDDAALFERKAAGDSAKPDGERLARVAQRLPADIAARYRVVRADVEVRGDQRLHDHEQPVLVGDSVRLAPGSNFLGEIYARDALLAPDGNVLRAVLCDGGITLGARCGVLRWAHAQRITLGQGSRAAGRLSASESIRIAAGCRFERLSAPRIEFGNGATADAPAPSRALRPADLAASRRIEWQAQARRWLCNGDLDIGDDLLVDGDLVVHGKLRLGARCQVRGSVKAHGSATIGAGSRVSGALFARGAIDVGAGCHLSGPLSSSRSIRLGDGCTVGSGARMSSLAAPVIAVNGNCTCHGAIWARSLGNAVG